MLRARGSCRILGAATSQSSAPGSAKDTRQCHVGRSHRPRLGNAPGERAGTAPRRWLGHAPGLHRAVNGNPVGPKRKRPRSPVCDRRRDLAVPARHQRGSRVRCSRRERLRDRRLAGGARENVEWAVARRSTPESVVFDNGASPELTYSRHESFCPMKAP